MKKICLSATPFSPEQKLEIQAFAAQHASEMMEIDRKADNPVDILNECDILIGYFPRELIQNARALKWLHSPSAGVDKLTDETIYPNADVILTNSSGAFGIAIAEYLVCGLLMLMRKMPEYMENKRQGIWKSAGDAGSVYGSTITVVGLGDLGSNFAMRAKALGATVRAVKRTVCDKPDYVDALYTTAQLKEAVTGADAVVLCMPATPGTIRLVSKDVIACMKEGALLLNAGRGCTLDEDALIQALQTGKLGGAVLDVTTQEPLPTQSPLWKMDNVILTPHISGSDNDPLNARLMFDLFMNNLARYYRGEPLQNVVDRKQGY